MARGNHAADKAPGQGFPERLRELRRQKNLSQEELGRLAEVHFTHISRYERGLSRPSSDTLKRLANALGVTGDYLLEGTTEEAARANFEDRELLLQFQEVERLEPQEKSVVKSFLEAFLFKHRVQQMARQG